MSVGGCDLLGHWQGMSLGPTIPVFVHLVRPGKPEMEAELSVLHCPIVGKFLGRQPRVLQASSDKNIPGTDFDT